MAERTTVRLPRDLLVRAKKKAAREGRTLTSLIEEGLHAVMARPPKRAEGPKIPISATFGGFGEASEPSETAPVAHRAQELEDAAYVERMKSLP